MPNFSMKYLNMEHNIQNKAIFIGFYAQIAAIFIHNYLYALHTKSMIHSVIFRRFGQSGLIEV